MPFSGCESGRLREAPTRNQEPSGGRNRIRQDTGPSGSGPARRKAGLRSARRHRRRRASAPDRSGRTGLRPGSCEPAGPRASAHGLARRNQGLRPEDPAGCGTKASAEEPPKAGREAQAFESAKRRTVRASALTGSPRGNRKTASAEDGPRRKRWHEPPAHSSVPRNRPERGTPRLPGWVQTRRDSGGRQRCRPPLSCAPDGRCRRSRRSAAVPRASLARRGIAPNRCAAVPVNQTRLDLGHIGADSSREAQREAPPMFSRSTPAPAPKPSPPGPARPASPSSARRP